MSNVRDEFGNPIYQTDEYGKPIYQTDQYGNPIQTQAGTAGTGTGGGDYGHGTAPTATGYGGSEPVMGATVGEQRHHEGLQRSKSSSSSSSEDDGQGGRRRKKKGLKDKVKEKIPGMGHKKEEGHHTGTGATATTGTTTASTGTTGYGHEQQRPGEKKGIMEKIKEKLPGGGGHH